MYNEANQKRGTAMLDSYLSALCQYAVRTGLIQTDDVVCCRNALLEALALDSFD